MRYFYLFFLMLLIFSSCGKEDKKDTSTVNETGNMKYRRHALPTIVDENERSIYEKENKQDLSALYVKRDELIKYLEDDKNKEDGTKYSEKQDELKVINEYIHVLTICNDVSTLQEVEFYKGDLGVTKEFVDKLSPYVGQIQVIEDFGTRFNGPSDSEGNIEGLRLCTCTLISDDLAITAGHCFNEVNDLKLPKRKNKTISNNEVARLMKVNFNYQIDKNTNQKRSDSISFPIEELVEIKFDDGDIDYAIIRLGKTNNVTAGQKFGYATVSNKNADLSETICLIQHPNQETKQIEAGSVKYVPDKFTKYNNLDTKGASSGSAIFGRTGSIVGVHTDGGCDKYDPQNTYNYGYSIETIISHSKKIKELLNK